MANHPQGRWNVRSRITELTNWFKQKDASDANRTGDDGNGSAAPIHHEPNHRTAAPSRSATKGSRSTSAPDSVSRERRVTFGVLPPSIATRNSSKQHLSKSRRNERFHRANGPPRSPVDLDAIRLDIKLKQATLMAHQSTSSHRVAWSGSNLTSPPEDSRPPIPPRSGLRDYVLTANDSTPSTCVTTLRSTKQPRLAAAMSQSHRCSVMPNEHPDPAGSLMPPGIHNASRSIEAYDEQEGPRISHSCSDQPPSDQALSMMIRERLADPHSAYMRESLEHLLRASREVISQRRTAGDCRCKARCELDQAELNLAGRLHNDPSGESPRARRSELRPASTVPSGNDPQRRAILSASSSVYSRSVSSTAAKQIEPLPVQALSSSGHAAQGSTRASSISRRMISVTEFPPDRVGARDSGVEFWSAEEIELVRMSIQYAEGY